MAPKNDKKEEAAMKNRILGGGGRGRRSVEFKKHIYEVAKEKNPELEITVECIETMDEVMNDVLHKIVDEAAKNAAASNQSSLQIKDLYAALTKIYPGDLARYANLHGYIACTTYETNLAQSKAFNEHQSQQLADYLRQVKI